MNPDTIAFPSTEATGYVTVLSKQDNSQNEWLFRMYSQGNSENRDNRISFYCFNLIGGEGNGGYFQDTITPGEWIHVVGVIDITNGEADPSSYVAIYKNGVFRQQMGLTIANGGTADITIANGTAPIRLATGKNAASFFKGKLDDVRIFNRVLTGAEILSLYNTNPTIASGLVGWWKLDEGSGTTIIDSSSTANNGTITGATYI